MNSAEWNRPPNSALDLTVRPVTPVAGAQRARQSVPQVSASVRRRTRCLTLAISCALLIASSAGAQVVNLPATPCEAVSPDGRFAVVCVPVKGQDYTYSLVLQDRKAHATTVLEKQFERGVGVAWSPDSRDAAVTFWAGSNIAFVRVYAANGGEPAFDPERAIWTTLGAPPEVSKDGHVYVEALGWRSNDTLLVRISGHNDSPPANSFCVCFTVSLRGDAKRARPCPYVKR